MSGERPDDPRDGGSPTEDAPAGGERAERPRDRDHPAERTPLSGERPDYLWDGGFPAWPLPADGTAVGAARSIVRSVFAEFGMPPGPTYDATVIVSELTSNALVHGSVPSLHRSTAPGPEIWAYVSRREPVEIVVKVFDAVPWAGHVKRPPPDATSGRGLEVVDALTAEHGGRWGVHPTRGRLGPGSPPGKAVFFTTRLPADRWGFSVRPEPRPGTPPAERIRLLLSGRGLRPRVSAGHGMAVVEVRAGLHIWTYEESLSYSLPGRGIVRHPPFDEIEVVEQVVRHCEEHIESGTPVLS